MEPDKLMKLLVLQSIRDKKMIVDNSKYDSRAILKDYVNLKKEFLSEYALNNTSKEK